MDTRQRRRQTGKRRRPPSAVRRPADRRSKPVTPKENRRFLQLVICSGIFVLLVAVKLLLPGQLSRMDKQLSAMLEQNMDVRAVFSAVGRAISGETEGVAEDVYQAVFQPQQTEEVLETAVAVPAELPQPVRLPQVSQMTESEEDPSPQTVETATLACVLYSQENLPANVNLAQDLLGFDYVTPLAGTMTSDFGYREHPTVGEERFHYGVDIGGETGADICCFADGRVTAVGDSSSYGKYLIVTHGEHYSTLYAHCSKITVSSGAEVARGEKIAEVGETGIATGPHLHFELQRDGTYLNPVYYVDAA